MPRTHCGCASLRDSGGNTVRTGRSLRGGSPEETGGGAQEEGGTRLAASLSSGASTCSLPTTYATGTHLLTMYSAPGLTPSTVHRPAVSSLGTYHALTMRLLWTWMCPLFAFRHIAALLHDLMRREMQEARGIKLAHLALAGRAVWLGHDLHVEGCRVLAEGFFP